MEGSLYKRGVRNLSRYAGKALFIGRAEKIVSTDGLEEVFIDNLEGECIDHLN